MNLFLVIIFLRIFLSISLPIQKKTSKFGISNYERLRLKQFLSSSSTNDDVLKSTDNTNLQKVNSETKSRGKRQRVLPGKRQRNSDNSANVGRVSVYSVGSSIDLQALRVHIFRRGFGRFTEDSTVDKPDLVLTRGDDEIEDDGVLHVSNAPLFISAVGFENGEVELASVSNAGTSSYQFDEDEEASAVKYEIEMKTRERILMATQDIFYFDYGCVVFWGLTSTEEKAALTELREFTKEPVSESELDESYDTLEFVFDRKVNPQRPIRFDRMRLRSLQLAEKLALSYAMAQSSKLFVFEDRVLSSVEMTRYLPKELAVDGKIISTKKEDDEHKSAYEYTRSYLEVDDRVALLNSRLTVIRELLDVLTAQIADANSTRLEWIIIWLITVEIVMGIASSPLFVGKRVLAAVLVPTAILVFNKFRR